MQEMTLLQDFGKVMPFIDDNTLTVNVARLRKKLENVGMEGRIKTKKGIGYYLDK